MDSSADATAARAVTASAMVRIMVCSARGGGGLLGGREWVRVKMWVVRVCVLAWEAPRAAPVFRSSTALAKRRLGERGRTLDSEPHGLRARGTRGRADAVRRPPRPARHGSPSAGQVGRGTMVPRSSPPRSRAASSVPWRGPRGGARGAKARPDRRAARWARQSRSASGGALASPVRSGPSCRKAAEWRKSLACAFRPMAGLWDVQFLTDVGITTTRY